MNDLNTTPMPDFDAPPPSAEDTQPILPPFDALDYRHGASPTVEAKPLEPMSDDDLDLPDWYYRRTEAPTNPLFPASAPADPEPSNDIGTWGDFELPLPPDDVAARLSQRAQTLPDFNPFAFAPDAEAAFNARKAGLLAQAATVEARRHLVPSFKPPTRADLARETLAILDELESGAAPFPSADAPRGSAENPLLARIALLERQLAARTAECDELCRDVALESKKVNMLQEMLDDLVSSVRPAQRDTNAASPRELDDNHSVTRPTRKDVTTLVQSLTLPEERRAADADLAAYLGDGWTALDITINTAFEAKTHHVRIVTLTRDVTDVPAPEQAAAAVELDAPSDFIREMAIEGIVMTPSFN